MAWGMVGAGAGGSSFPMWDFAPWGQASASLPFGGLGILQSTLLVMSVVSHLDPFSPVCSSCARPYAPTAFVNY